MDNDFYYTYKNAAGEIITAQTPTRCCRQCTNEVGYVRRPTDRLLTLGFFYRII